MPRGSQVAKAKESERISLDEARKVQGRGATGSKPGAGLSSRGVCAGNCRLCSARHRLCGFKRL